VQVDKNEKVIKKIKKELAMAGHRPCGQKAGSLDHSNDKEKPRGKRSIW
jgi:hypothetical protein